MATKRTRVKRHRRPDIPDWVWLYLAGETMPADFDKDTYIGWKYFGEYDAVIAAAREELGNRAKKPHPSWSECPKECRNDANQTH